MNSVAKCAVLLFLINIVLTDCNTGCLVCSKAGNCLLCDFINGYYLFNNACSRDSAGNCMYYQVNTASGSCLQCNSGYYIDSAQQCVEVTTEIDNCLAYSANNICSQCNAGYTVQGNACVEVTNPIANCLSYSASSATTCIECAENYILTVDGSACTFNPSIRDCANFSYITCLTCESGNYLNQNAYLDTFKAAINNNNVTLINTEAHNFMSGNIDQVATTKCTTTAGTNCLLFDSMGVCNSCVEGYYLNSNNQCAINPIEPIVNCAVYASLTTCGQCDSGFHLNATEACIADTVIDNCLTYNQSAKSTTCVACTPNFYRVNNGCVSRTNSNIINCATYSTTADICITCSGSNKLTNDSLACLAPVENCVSYATSNATTINLQCAACDNTYYLNPATNVCTAGTVPSCQQYQTSSNVCTRCVDGFYLSGTGCVRRTTTIADCLTYTATADDSCALCNGTSIYLSLDNSCKIIQNIDNCATYTKWNICGACNDGFYLTNNTCLQIPVAENCLQRGAGTTCAKCKSGYFLTNDACVLIPSITIGSCLTQQTAPTSPNACVGCNIGTMPFSYTSKYLCRNSASLNSSTIENCTRYVLTNGALTCSRCQTSFVVASNGLSCVTSCTNDEAVLVGDVSFAQANSLSAATINSYAKCYSIANDQNLEGCDVVATALNKPNAQKVCTKCKTGYVPIQICPMEVSYFGASSFSNSDLGASSITVICIYNPAPLYAPNFNGTPVSNCEYYTTDGASNYYCTKCSFGYTSIVGVSNGMNYVTCGVAVPGCNANVKYGNAMSNAKWMEEMFGFNITHMYTCNKCTDTAQIPFLHLNNSNVIEPYDLTSDVPSTGTTLNGNVVACRAPTANGLNMTVAQFTSFPANCALGLYIVDRTKSSSTAVSSSVLCMACANGFKPTYDNDGYLITGCVSINNCNTASTITGWFNSCNVCNTTSAYQYNTTTAVLSTDVCATTSAVNCFATDSTNANKCSICKKGYTFNYDNVCEALKPDSCAGYNDLAANSFDPSSSFNQLQLAYYFLLDAGCTTCSNDYILAKDTTSLQSCDASPYVVAATFPISTSYISQCNSYYLNNGIKCATCATGYILNSTSTRCTLATTFPSCQVTNEAVTACQTCNSSTTRVNTTCVTRSINNCASYSQGAATLICTRCVAGFVLSSNACTRGTVSNCSVYSATTGSCTNCASGYTLVTENGISHQCMQIPTNLHCSSAWLENSNTSLQCDACNSGYSFTDNTVDYPDNICLPINQVNNCATYDIKADLEQSTFACTACSTLFYLTNNTCVGRKVTTGCRTYNVTADVCTSCLNNYYLDTLGTCKSFVVGVTNCAIYSNSTTCSRCNRNFYLSANQCIAVATAALISNCTIYSSANTCSTCATGYALIANSTLR